MDFFLFLLVAFLVFGAGFVIAGLQIAFAFALFIGLFFGGTILAIFLIGLALSPAFFLASLFLIAWLVRRSTRPQIEPPLAEK